MLEGIGDERSGKRADFHHVPAPARRLDPRVGAGFVQLPDVRFGSLGARSQLEMRDGFALIGMERGDALGIGIP